MLANDIIITRGSQDMMTWFDKMQSALSNQAFTATGLAIGSVSAATLKIVNTVTFTSSSVLKTKATAAVPFTATTHDIAASTSSVQEAIYLVTLSSAGTPTVTKGTTASGAGTAKFPDVPAGGTPIGFARIAVAAGSTSFVATSDLLSAGHLTVTYSDILGSLLARFDSAI